MEKLMSDDVLSKVHVSGRVFGKEGIDLELFRKKKNKKRGGMVPASFLCIFLYIGPWFLGKMVLENQRLRMLCTNIVRMALAYL